MANAGDSRGVLCRAGDVAHALSEDHNPLAFNEKFRITMVSLLPIDSSVGLCCFS